MSDKLAADLWEKLIQVLDDSLQYGFLEQISAVVKITLVGNELQLSVATDEAFKFFKSEINQQRIMILTRPVHLIDKVTVVRVEAEIPERRRRKD